MEIITNGIIPKIYIYIIVTMLNPYSAGQFYIRFNPCAEQILTFFFWLKQLLLSHKQWNVTLTCRVGTEKCLFFTFNEIIMWKHRWPRSGHGSQYDLKHLCLYLHVISIIITCSLQIYLHVIICKIFCFINSTVNACILSL